MQQGGAVIRRGKRLAMLGAAAGIAGAALWWCLRDTAPAPPPPPAKTELRVLLGAFGAPAAVPATPPASAVSAGADFCDASASRTQSDDFTLDSLQSAKVRAANTALTVLAGNTTPEAQYTAAYFHSSATLAAADQALARERVKCAADTACVDAAEQAADQSRERSLAPLVRLAAASKDTRLYALAYAQCFEQARNQANGSCAQLGAARWAQLAPDALEPRIALAKEAWAKGDKKAMESALASVAAFSGKLAPRPPAYQLLQQSDALSRLSISEQELLYITLLETATAVAPEMVISGFCGTGLAAGAEQLRLCDVLANRMASEKNSLGQLKASMTIAKKLAWPPERVEEIRLEAKKLNQVFVKHYTGQRNSCISFHRYGQFAGSMLDGQEMAAYDALLRQRQ